MTPRKAKPISRSSTPRPLLVERLEARQMLSASPFTPSDPDVGIGSEEIDRLSYVEFAVFQQPSETVVIEPPANGGNNDLPPVRPPSDADPGSTRPPYYGSDEDGPEGEFSPPIDVDPPPAFLAVPDATPGFQPIGIEAPQPLSEQSRAPQTLEFEPIADSLGFSTEDGFPALSDARTSRQEIDLVFADREFQDTWSAIIAFDASDEEFDNGLIELRLADQPEDRGVGLNHADEPQLVRSTTESRQVDQINLAYRFDVADPSSDLDTETVIAWDTASASGQAPIRPIDLMLDQPTAEGGFLALATDAVFENLGGGPIVGGTENGVGIVGIGGRSQAFDFAQPESSSESEEVTAQHREAGDATSAPVRVDAANGVQADGNSAAVVPAILAAGGLAGLRRKRSVDRLLKRFRRKES